MMIKKLAKINHIFSYSFFDWDKINPEHGNNPNDPVDVFKKNNVLFAENGNGKSKLVDIFKSADGQTIELKKSWHRTSADSQDTKIILGDGSEIDFDGLRWSNENLKNKFLIFDKHFIEGFVHSVGPNYTDTPQRRQQRGRNIVYLGNFAEYNNEIDRVNALKNAISEKNGYFSETEKAKIAGLLNGHGITIEELAREKGEIQKLKKDNLNGKKERLTKHQSELEKLEKALKEKNKIAALSLLSEIKLSFSLEVEQENEKKVTLDPSKLFSFTVAKGVQQTLHKIAHKKDFVKRGQATYDRRNPRDPAQCGFRIEYNGEDCTSSLSEGEKQVIALAFFFAQLRKENDKEKIVVLDDPITSFDAGKRKSTAEVIQKETKDFEQLFILTCDPLFREYCLKQIDNRNFYYIFKTMGSSSIHYVPCNRETIYSSFETEFKDIENTQGSNENVIVYGQKLRFCLETKIKEDYFGYSEDNLANMIKKVTGRNKEEFEKLFSNKEAILQIYSYCNTGGLAHYPKDGSTSWNELRDKIKQYLDLEL